MQMIKLSKRIPERERDLERTSAFSLHPSPLNGVYAPKIKEALRVKTHCSGKKVYSLSVNQDLLAKRRLADGSS